MKKVGMGWNIKIVCNRALFRVHYVVCLLSVLLHLLSGLLIFYDTPLVLTPLLNC